MNESGTFKSSMIFKGALLISVLLAAILTMFIFTSQAQAATLTILDDPSGGDCLAIGSWEPATRTCTLTSAVNLDTIDVGSDGVTVDGNGKWMTGYSLDPWNLTPYAVTLNGRTGVTVKNLNISSYLNPISLSNSSGNTIFNIRIMDTGYAPDPDGYMVGYYGVAINLSSSHNNQLMNNTLTGMDGWFETDGVSLYESNGNELFNNSVSAFQTGLWIHGTGNILHDNTIGDSAGIGLALTELGGNTVYRNNFVNNLTHAITYSNADIFNLPLPNGGNYWSGWTAPDANGDLIVDSPFMFDVGAQDNLPWKGPDAWKDSVSPVISSVQPAGQIFKSSATVIVDYSDPAPSSGINASTVVVKLDGNPVTGCTISATRASCPATGLTAGTHLISGTVADASGNSAVIGGSFDIPFVDSVAPELTYLGPTGIVRSGSLQVSASYADAEPSSGLIPSSARIKLNSGSYLPCTVSGSPDFIIDCALTKLSIGSYSASISLTDNAGNTGIATGSFQVMPLTILDDATGGDCEALLGNWNTSTKTCTLDADLTIPASIDGIRIQGAGVTLDGDGHTVRGSGANSTIGFPSGVVAGGTGAQVKNITVINFGTGVSMWGAGSSATRVRAINNIRYGINATTGAIVDSSVIDGNGMMGIGCSSNVTVTNNTISNNNSDGIYIWWDVYNVHISGNLMLDNGGSGIHLSDLCDNNIISDNVISGSGGNGILIAGSSGNLISGNTLIENASGIFIESSYSYYDYLAASNNNLIFGNNFISNSTQSVVSGSSSNRFSQALPVGGNYWNDWTAPDADGDGFVDSPYIFSSGSDIFPRTTFIGPLSQKPELTLVKNGVFWASYADYLARELTVSVTTSNPGTWTAFNVSLDDAWCSNGVTQQTTFPIAVGNLISGDSAGFELKFHVAEGVGSFRVNFDASALDRYGVSYSYP